MIYIFGAKIQDNTLVVQGISKIFGIGNKTSKKICKEFGFLNKLKIFNLSRCDWVNIESYIIERKYLIENDLRQLLKLNISSIINNKSYKGIRHQLGLPVRGQRTRSNMSTQKKLYIFRLPNKRNFSSAGFCKLKFFFNRLKKKQNKIFLNSTRFKYSLKTKSQYNVYSKFYYNNKMLKQKKLKRYYFKKLKNISNKYPKKQNYILNIFSKYSNIFLFLTCGGKLIKSFSGGTLDLKGKQKGSPFSARLVMDKMFKFIKFFKIKHFSIYKSGKGSSKKITLRRLFIYKKYIKILRIREIVNIPHGGTRLKKKKR